MQHLSWFADFAIFACISVDFVFYSFPFAFRFHVVAFILCVLFSFVSHLGLTLQLPYWSPVLHRAVIIFLDLFLCFLVFVSCVCTDALSLVLLHYLFKNFPSLSASTSRYLPRLPVIPPWVHAVLSFRLTPLPVRLLSWFWVFHPHRSWQHDWSE